MLRYTVERFDVVQVSGNAEDGVETTVVYRGCCQGEAEAVAAALTGYWGAAAVVQPGQKLRVE